MMIMRGMFFALLMLAGFLSAGAQELTILHMNDTHSHMEAERGGRFKGKGGVIEQAAYIDSVRLADGRKNVLLLHAGDFSQGSSYFTEMHGNIEVDVLDAMGFDVVCLGNHEFDNGMAELARRLKRLRTPAVCANYVFAYRDLGKQIKPYVILKKGGRKIGVIGLLTDLSTVVNKDIATSIKYLDPAETADRYASLLKKKGCDLVICLTHLGYEGEMYTDFQLASSVRNVDVIVGGHSHTVIDRPGVVKNPDGKDVIIVTDGKWGIEIGNLKVR